MVPRSGGRDERRVSRIERRCRGRSSLHRERVGENRGCGRSYRQRRSEEGNRRRAQDRPRGQNNGGGNGKWRERNAASDRVGCSGCRERRKKGRQNDCLLHRTRRPKSRPFLPQSNLILQPRAGSASGAGWPPCLSPAARFRRTRIREARIERCPTRILRFPGPLQRPGGRPDRARKSGATAKAARSAQRKASVVLELLRGTDLESTSRKYGVTGATLAEWRDAFLAGRAEGPKVRQKPRSTRRTGVSGESSWWP